MKKTIFKGAGVAIITPFTEDGVNFAELSRIIEDQIKGGTDAIVITGTSGESATMTDEEHRAAIKCAVDTVKGRIPVIAGTGSNETSYAIELSKYAEEVGADAVLVVTPYYNKCTQKGLIAHYKAIADSINIPIVLYDVPSRTGVGIQIPTYVELAKIPNIVAVKEANGDLSKILRLRAACGDSLDVYSGNDDQIVPILSAARASSPSSRTSHRKRRTTCASSTSTARQKKPARCRSSMPTSSTHCSARSTRFRSKSRCASSAMQPARCACRSPPEHEKQLETALRNHGLIK